LGAGRRSSALRVQIIGRNQGVQLPTVANVQDVYFVADVVHDDMIAHGNFPRAGESWKRVGRS
jgi:hypothetical protein